MSEDKSTQKDKIALYFLAWQDCIDRLDTLLLETRHLQENIIYMLRSPILYRSLRYEEKFLWDKDAFCTERLVKIVKEEGCDSKTLTDKLADEAIILYPNPKPDTEKKKGLKDTRGEIENQLNEFVEDVLLKLKWSTEQRRHYHNLYALQKIKRNIFSDKLLLIQEGFYTFGIFPKRPLFETEMFETENLSERKNILPKFMLLRSVILRRIWDYVSRLGDHQEEFSKSLDMGLQDHPRPSMERRREQRIYSSYLSQRCTDLWLVIKMLVDEGFDKSSKSLRRPSLLHRWHHEFTSRAHSFFDNVEDTLIQQKQSNEKRKPPLYSHYINTSYFMPERPNLQSLIAHEVAHSFLKDYLDDMSRQELSLNDSAFHRLIKQLNQCLEVYEANRMLETSPSSPVKEIAVDLLASAVEGPAYLYALFLEITGTGLEKLFMMGKYNEIELKLYDHLKGAGGQYDQEREWYIRLHAVCAWLSEIFKEDSDSPRIQLTQRLIKAIQSVLEELLDYLDEIARPDRKWKLYWESLQKRMCDIIRQSEAPREVKKWWEERTGDYYNDKHRWPVYTYPLHKEVQKYLLNSLAVRTTNEIDHTVIRNHYYQIKKKFDLICNDRYKLKSSLLLQNGDGKEKERNKLFEYIYDIPWQSAFLYGLDCVHEISGPPLKRIDWINRLHQFSISNRKMYQIALDFHLTHVEFPYLRLREVIRLLTDEQVQESVQESGGANYEGLKELHKKSPPLIKKIGEWLQGNDFNSELEFSGFNRKPLSEIEEKKIEEFRNDIKDKAKKENIKTFIKNKAEEKTAFFLLKMTSVAFEPKEKHILSRIISKKLDMLCEIIDELKINDDFKILKPLFSYLKVISLKNKSGTDKTFVSKITDAMSLEDNMPFPIGIKQYVIGRVSVGAAYRLHKDSFDTNELFLKSAETDSFRMKSLIGRYDFLIYGPTRKQGHYWLPFFPNKETPPPPKDTNSEANKKTCIFCPQQTISEQKELPQCNVCSYENGFIKSYPQFQGKLPPQEKEKFLPFFIRWEYAVPIRLTKEKWAETKEKEPLALISIVLKQSASRLYFLYRLLSVSQNNASKVPVPINLEELEGYFQDGDRAFLSDGWEDFLIMFSGDPKRVEDIFKIQKILFEDFQAERTELIFTPKALDYVFEKNAAEKVGIEILGSHIVLVISFLITAL